MAEKTVVVSQQNLKPIKILKWKVKEGFSISIGSLIFVYDFEEVEKDQQHKYKSSQAGTVSKLIAQEGAIIQPGEALFEMEPCIHPTVMKDMCAECGADLRKDDLNATASVPMIHSVPELKVSEELAQKLGKADGERLLRDKKLVLLVDLDQTLIHTTNDIIPPNLKDVYHFQLYGPNSLWYHTRLRPGTHEFLSNVSSYFELHICTFGARNYAHKITAILDADGRFFSNRVLSRDECFNPTSKTANLKALFPCGDHMVCIIDDREDVWSHAANLIHVKPYHFFQHTGDINAPPGLEKLENDEKKEVNFSNIKSKTSAIEEDNQQCNNNKINNLETNNIDSQKDEESVISKNDINDTNTNQLDPEENINGEDEVANRTLPNNLSTSLETADKEMTEDTSRISTENDVEEKLESLKSDTDKDQQTEEKSPLNSSLNLIKVDDPDNYLIYLEDVLRRIHKAFYDEYDKMESGNVPDLKKIIPAVKGQVLKGCKMIFSGLVPTHIQLEHSRAYQVAKSLGATVTQDYQRDTTHLVAVRPGTAKVNAGRKRKNLKIVTPDWLWACAERWKHIQETKFPLNSKGSKNRHPPPHCSSPEHVPNYAVHEKPGARKRSPSGRFMDTINPLMSFSSADIADMDKEVEDILDAESESEAEDLTETVTEISVTFKDIERHSSSSSSSSVESLTAEMPRGHKRKINMLKEDEDEDDGENTKDSDEFPSTKFRRGEQLDSDLDIGQDSNSEGNNEAPDEIDDGEWNMMGAALEREFLSNS